MSTIEDKILNGPTVHYCDAENDDIRPNENSDTDDVEPSMERKDTSSLFVRPNDNEERIQTHQRYVSGSTNTGPKGVLEDYRRRSLPKPKGDKINDDSDDLEAEFRELMTDDSIIKQIAEQRLNRERQSSAVPQFGQVYRLGTGTELLEAIDKEHRNVLVLVLIYIKFSKICSRVDRCLDQLARNLKQIKIVTLDASVAGLSENFKNNGVPALLAYRNGNLVKSFVQLEDQLDQDFDHNRIEELLVDGGLVDRSQQL